MTNLDLLTEIISNSNITNDQKLSLVEAFSGLDDDSLENLLNLLKKERNLINLFAENLEAKQTAYSLGDKEVLESITLQEQAILKGF